MQREGRNIIRQNMNEYKSVSGEKESAPNVYAKNRLTKIIIKRLII